MKKLTYILKKLLKWIFKYFKYLILIFICFIVSLFNKDEKEKMKTKEKEIKRKKEQTLSPKYNSSELPETPHTLIQNYLFNPTKEEIKEEILKFYCEEVRIPKYKLAKENFQEIEQLEEMIIPLIEEEITKKEIKNEEALQERIVYLGKIERLKKIEDYLKNPILPKKEIKMQISQVPLQITKEKPILEESTKYPKIATQPTFRKEIKENQKVEPKVSFANMPERKIPPLNQEDKKIAEKEKDNNIKKEPLNLAPNTPPEKNIIISLTPPEKYKKEQKSEEEIVSPKKQEIEPKIEQEDKKEERKEQEEQTESLNMLPIEQELRKIKEMKKIELTKENLEDKNYDDLIAKIDILLKKIKDQEKKSLKTEDLKKLKEKEQTLLNIKSDLENNLASDLEKEEKQLQENITKEELTGLELELKKLQLEHQMDLNNHLLNKAEDLENLSKENLNKIEKELIKIKLKKACKYLELPSLLILPFIRNRYFALFTAGLFLNNHLNFLNNILHHHTYTYLPEDLLEIQKGENALEKALELTKENRSYLEYLEINILKKYPELSLDQEYLIYINELKFSLIKNEEKMLKKKKMIKKYNLKYQVKIRKLKHKMDKT